MEKTLYPGPGERVGWGAIGYEIELDGMRLVNLGDSLLERDAWRDVSQPDLLMIPIGGEVVGNTMDVKQAVEAVEMIQPKVVVPCHYNCPAFFTKRYNPANARAFKEEVEALGSRCVILSGGESLTL